MLRVRECVFVCVCVEVDGFSFFFGFQVFFTPVARMREHETPNHEVASAKPSHSKVFTKSRLI